MPYTLSDMANEVRAELSARSPTDCAEELCRIVARGLTDPEFVRENLPDRAPGAHPRQVLYEDPDLGFCICGHVHDGPAGGKPHDHGSSWAIYGQAEGVTEMTDWKIVEKGEGDAPSLVERARVYELRPGDAHFYAVGAVHSPMRKAAVRLIRVEGANLDRVTRSNIEAA